MSLTLVRGSGLDLTAYSDAVYADKSNGRRSVSETAITLGGAAVSWASITRRVRYVVYSRSRVRSPR